MMNYSNKPKVVIVAPDALPIPPIRGGGIENGIWEILPHFKNYEIHVISAYNAEIDDLDPYEKVGDHHIHRIYLTKSQKDFLRLRHLSFNYHFPYAYEAARLINNIKPDIVHVRSRLWLIPYLNKYIKFNPVMILHHHNHYFYNMRNNTVRNYLKKISAFVGISKYTVNIEVAEKAPEYSDKSFVIYNGSNGNQFKPNAQARKRIREELGIADDSIMVLFVGRVKEDKGIDSALEAMIQLFSCHNNLYFVIVGSSWFGDNNLTPFIKRLKEMSRDFKDRVLFTGYKERSVIADYFSAADIFLGPSRMQEPFGQVFTEAMLSELPVVSTTRGGIPEIVMHGETGYLVESPEDIQQIRSYLDILIKDPYKRREMGMKGRKHTLANFSWMLAAEQTEKMYDTLLKQS